IYRRVFETGEPALNVELHGATPANPENSRDWLVNYHPLKHPDGQVYAVCGMVMDITERKRNELRQQKLEAQLREAQKMEALGTLAGGTAHEFNNILGIIIGFSESMKFELGEAHPAQADLSEILKASHRAKEIVQQVLTFSRQQKQERQLISLLEATREALKQVRAMIPEVVEIQSELPADGPPILGNATQIHQVIVNICVNAWHAMEGGQGRITVQLRQQTLDELAGTLHSTLRPGIYWCLSISDNGRGMSAKTLERIFEPFFTTKSPGQGTGLGLAVVHGIMQTHEGAVVASSELGMGSRFDLYFPAQLAAEITTSTAPLQETLAGGGRHVLVVDDEPSLNKVINRILQRQGYRTTAAASAAEALRYLRLAPASFDLVITDFSMPEIDGLSLARTVRELCPELPVILTSGYHEESMMADPAVNNVRTFLQKPLVPDQLLAAVQTVLK
ncbi:MAG TPA: response regulator, partial [Verrucomicrobiae bacterium]